MMCLGDGPERQAGQKADQRRVRGRLGEAMLHYGAALVVTLRGVRVFTSIDLHMVSVMVGRPAERASNLPFPKPEAP